MRRTRLILFAGIVASCADAPNTAQEPRVPSTQVEASGDSAAILAADTTPFATIGDASGAELLSPIAIRLMKDGEILVADAGLTEVRVFGSDGRLIRHIGQRGDGPGEYRSIGGASIADDTVVVYDPSLRRVTWFRRSGERVRDQPIRVPVTSGGSFLGAWLGRPLMSTEQIISREPIRTPGPLPEAGFRRERLLLLSFTADGKDFAILDDIPGAERFVQLVNMGDGVAVGYTPFGYERRAVAATNGRLVAYGVTDSSRLAIRRANDVTVIDWQSPPAAFSRDYLRVVEETDTTLDGDQIDVLHRAPTPPTFPVYDRLLVTHDGHIWVRSWAWPDQLMRTWLVFDTAGVMRAKVDAPASWRVVDADSTRIAVRVRDELDVERVALYRLKRR